MPETIRNQSGRMMAAALVATVLIPSSPAQAEDYDLDCAVILCLAGGFPTGCGAAYSYMIRRITSVPPKPPFGFCAMGNLSDVDFPDNDDPAAHDAMIAVIDDPGVARTLRSVRAEVSDGPETCTTGGGDGDQYKCSRMIELNGDGSNLFMGTRGGVDRPFWRRGNRVLFVDHEGTGKSIGNASHYNVTGRECEYEGGQVSYCYNTYSWQRIATPAGQ